METVDLPLGFDATLQRGWHDAKLHTLRRSDQYLLQVLSQVLVLLASLSEAQKRIANHDWKNNQLSQTVKKKLEIENLDRNTQREVD